jgi:polar amino acid transport system substrate-binding protein
MKKFLLVSLAVVMTASVLIGCGKKADKTSSGAEDILSSVKKSDSIAGKLPDSVKTAGKIIIGLDDAYPPMEFRDDKNVLVGFDVDFGNALGKKLGVEIEWKPTAWDGIILSLQSKKFDMILSSLSITEDRKKEIGFSQPYIQGGPVIITKKGNTTIKTSDDFKDKVIGVQLGSTADDAVSSLTGPKEVKKYNKVTEALQDLSNGRVEAVAADDQVGRYYVGLAGDKYEVVGKMVEEPFGIGFRKDEQQFIDAVQAAIDELKAEGTLSKISLKWFKEDIYK